MRNFTSTLAFGLVVVVSVSPTMAAPFTYAPKHCEFQITFPEKPFIEQKCGQKADSCTEVVSFTKAVGNDASTNFRVTCNALKPAEIETYSQPIVEETLLQLVKSAQLTPYDVVSDNKGAYTSSSILSIGERDGRPIIYNAQIWMGSKSMFTIEAEMLGNKNDIIEKTFADILKSTFPKDALKSSN